MSQTTETFTLGEVVTKTGSGKKGPWKLYILKSQDGQTIGSTFTAAIGGAAEGLIGQAVEVDLFHDGEYFTVKAVRPGSSQFIPAPAAPVSQSSGQYYKPRDPKESRSIIRQVALKAAATVAAGMSTDIGSADITALASTFEVWLTRPLPSDVAVGGQDEDIPF